MKLLYSVRFRASRDTSVGCLRDALDAQILQQVCASWTPAGVRLMLSQDEEERFLNAVSRIERVASCLSSLRRDPIFDLSDVDNMPIVQVARESYALDCVISNWRDAFERKNVCSQCCSADWVQVGDLSVEPPDPEEPFEYAQDIILAFPNCWLLQGRALEVARSLRLEVRDVNQRPNLGQLVVSQTVRVPMEQDAFGPVKTCSRCKRVNELRLLDAEPDSRTQLIEARGVEFMDQWQPIGVDLSGVVLADGFLRSDSIITRDTRFNEKELRMDDLREKWESSQPLFFSTPRFLRAIGTSGIGVFPVLPMPTPTNMGG